MITLKTLPEATAQEVFDQVKTHLLKQGEKSVNNRDACVYKSINGNKCAAGCLISDEEYTRKFEGMNWISLSFKMLVPLNHRELIVDLQLIHDKRNLIDWKNELKDLANKHNLKF
jgi:hypothetical protein